MPSFELNLDEFENNLKGKERQMFGLKLKRALRLTIKIVRKVSAEGTFF